MKTNSLLRNTLQMAACTVALAIGAFAASPTSGQATLGAAIGSIQTPPNDTAVGPVLRLSGTASGNIRNLWLVVKVQGLHWPKGHPLTVAEGRWTGTFSESGTPPQGRIEVLLVDVPDKTSAALGASIENGSRTQRYPGLAESALEGARVLDRRPYRLPP